MGNNCPSEIQYGSDEDISKFPTVWATLPNETKKIFTDLYNNDLNAIRVFEKKPTLPYVFPYESTNEYPSVNCDKLPTLPTGVTLLMIKKQLNTRAQIMGLAIPFANACPSEIQYGRLEEISKMSAEWATLPNEAKKISTDLYNNDLNAIRVLEKKPTLPYVFPYEFDNEWPAVNCDKLPTLPTGVTLLMIKKQLNTRAQIMGLAIPFANACPSEIQYGRLEEISKMSAEWATLPNEAKKISTDLYNNDLNAIRVLEKKPTLPYVFPYEFDNEWPAVNCDKLPTLPTGVTLPMVKKQLNEVSQIMGLAIPFPDYNYTMLYIILLLLLVVVVAVIYAASRRSKPANKTKREGDYYY